MAYNKRNVTHFAKILSEKYNIPEKKVRALLHYGVRNMMKMIENGEDIYIPGFGHIYSYKKAFVERIDRFRKQQDERNNQDNDRKEEA